MSKRKSDPVGELFDETIEITQSNLCEICSVEPAFVESLVDEGILDPVGRPSGERCFEYVSVRTIQTTVRLQRDLGVNLSGAALALQLLERIEVLQNELRNLAPRSGRS